MVSKESAAWRQREERARQRRHSRGWRGPSSRGLDGAGVTGATGALPAASSGASGAPVPLPFHKAIPRPGQPQGHPDRSRARFSEGGAASTAPGFPAGASSSASFAPPTSFGNSGPLGILTEDLQRLNSYFQLSDQRKFAFQQRFGSVDLRALSRIDLSDVINTVDVQVLQSIMTNVTFSEVRERDLHLFSDHAMVKLIKVLQFSVEYLMNVQNSLLSSLDEHVRENRSAQQQLRKEREARTDTTEKYRSLRQFAKQQKRSLRLYEALLVRGKAGSQTAVQAVAQQRELLRHAADRASGSRRHKQQGQRRKERQRIDENVAANAAHFAPGKGGEQQCQDRQPTTITRSVVSVEKKTSAAGGSPSWRRNACAATRAGPRRSSCAASACRATRRAARTSSRA